MKCEDDDEELRQVSERRLEEARHRRPEALADLFGRKRDEPRQSCERSGRIHEREERRRACVVRDRGGDGGARDQRDQGPGSAHEPGNLTGSAAKERRSGQVTKRPGAASSRAAWPTTRPAPGRRTGRGRLRGGPASPRG